MVTIPSLDPLSITSRLYFLLSGFHGFLERMKFLLKVQMTPLRQREAKTIGPSFLCKNVTFALAARWVILAICIESAQQNPSNRQTPAISDRVLAHTPLYATVKLYTKRKLGLDFHWSISKHFCNDGIGDNGVDWVSRICVRSTILHDQSILLTHQFWWQAVIISSLWNPCHLHSVI